MKSKKEVSMKFMNKDANKDIILGIITAFIEELNPTEEDLSDIRAAVTEAIDNVIVHAYDNEEGKVSLIAQIENRCVIIKVKDEGIGIEDIAKAKQPLYSTKEDASGMGFTIMESFMDTVEIASKVGEGTMVTMKKTLSE